MKRSFKVADFNCLILCLGLISTIGCRARYQIVGPDSSDSVLTTGTGGPNAPVNQCSPTSLNIPEVPGLGGALYVDPSTAAANFATMVKDGVLQTNTVLLSEADIPTTNYNVGFPLPSGKKLTDDKGNMLETYYAMDLLGNIVLSPTETEGDYQFATLTDDGSNFLVQQNGTMQNIVASDGTHPTLLTCATKTIHLKPGEPLPFEFQYYQGPAYQIALTILWRKVNLSVSSSTKETLCGASGDSEFWTPATTTAAAIPTANFTKLLADGWTIPSPENFIYQTAETISCAVVPGAATANGCSTYVQLNAGSPAIIPVRDASQTCYYMKLITGVIEPYSTETLRTDVAATNQDGHTPSPWVIGTGTLDFTLKGTRDILLSGNNIGNGQISEASFLLMELPARAFAYGTSDALPSTGVQIAGSPIEFESMASTGIALFAPINIANQAPLNQATQLAVSALATSTLGQTSDIYITFR